MFDVLHVDLRRIEVLHADSRLSDRLVDFTVLGSVFYLCCVLLSVELEAGFFTQTMAYSALLLFFVSLSKKATAGYSASVGETICHILGNAIGIFVGTCVALSLAKIFSAPDEFFVAVILSGILAFFVLGTLSPFVYKTSLPGR